MENTEGTCVCSRSCGVRKMRGKEYIACVLHKGAEDALWALMGIKGVIVGCDGLFWM